MPHTEEQLVTLLYDVRERVPDGIYVKACDACKYLLDRRQAIRLMIDTVSVSERAARSWRRQYDRELDSCARRIQLEIGVY